MVEDACQRYLVLVGCDCRVQEVSCAGSPDHINVALNVRVRCEQIAVNEECILVSIDLAAVKSSKLAALDGKAERGVTDCS